MKVKLESGQEIELKELTIDERDELLDSVSYEGEGDSLKMKMMHSTMTKFIRIGVKGKVEDSFLKKLTFSEKSEIFTKIQSECMNLGEEEASK
jgi:hypothetical protein|tara:strand:+ start:144 stop:422 length:279 start_codon:yes stop_codon:yes gene_type:complete